VSGAAPTGPDPLARVAEQLSALEGAPVADHPEALEAVHRAVVSELEELSGIGAVNGRTGDGG
jgi:hypothetical protein